VVAFTTKRNRSKVSFVNCSVQPGASPLSAPLDMSVVVISVAVVVVVVVVVMVVVSVTCTYR